MQINLLKSALLALLVVTAFIAGRELWLRQQGFYPTFDDNSPLWAHTRDNVYGPKDKKVVFIGSSRIKFDLDIDTWQKETGTEAIQLAMVGSSPRKVLTDLADDEAFNGKLIIDVTEGLFFSDGPGAANQIARNLDYYSTYSPTQKVSFRINALLEKNLTLLDEEYFSINGLFKNFHLKNRENVMDGGMPPFPWEFDGTTYHRQSKMADRFVKDTALQNKVRNIWGDMSARRMQSKTPPPTKGQIDSVFLTVKQDLDKIRSRGGEVFFVRTPSDGPFWEGEKMGFPRAQFWDRLLRETGAQGIHFKDYQALSQFTCPEFSHLTPADAVIFTRELVSILREKGFMAPQNIASINR